MYPYPPPHGYPMHEQLPLQLSHGQHPNVHVPPSTGSYSTIPSNASPLSEPKTVNELKRSMSNEEKQCLHKHVSRHATLKVNECVKSWKRLAHSLGMNEIEINRIDSDYRWEGTGECGYQMLLRWIKTNDSEPTYEKLISALEHAHESHALHFVLDNLNDLANSS